MSCYSRAFRSLRTFGMCLHWNQEAKNQKSGFERNWVWYWYIYLCTVQNVSPTFRLHMHTQSNEYSTRFDVCEGFHQSSAMTLDSVKIHVQNETSPYQKLYLKTKTRRCSTPICNTTNQLCHLQNTWYSKQPFSIGCFKLDDSKSLHEKLLFHQTSIKIWLFGVPGRSQSFHERHTSLPTAPWYSIPSQSPPC